MLESNDNKILLSDLSRNGEWAEIIDSFEDDKFSDVLNPESDLLNLKPLALDIKSKISGTKKNSALKTGFKEIDEDLEFLNSGLIILEGQKQSGKTAISIQMALQVLDNNKDLPVFYFAYGDSKKDIQTRFLLHLANITRSEYRKADFTEKVITSALNKYQQFGKRLYIVQGTQGFYPNKIKESVGNTLNKFYEGNIPAENSCVVFVDYLQEVPSITGQTMEERIFQVTAALKDLSKLLASPIIIIYGNNDVERLVTQNEDIKVTVEKKENLDFASDVYISLIPTHIRGTDKPRKDIPKDIKPYRFSVSKNKNGEEGEKIAYYSPSHSRWYFNVF